LPKGNPSFSERSVYFRTYVGPRISDPKMVKSMDQLPTVAKDTKFFVGGVPPKMHRTALQGLFENAVIKCYLPKCRIVDVTCHEGFGFVTTSGLSQSEVESYLSKMKISHKSRRLDVKLAVDRKVAKENMEKEKGKKLLVCNLSKGIGHSHLQEYFSKFGKLDRAYVAYDPVSGSHKHFGFVIFEDIEVAKKVLKSKNHFICGVKTHVTENLLKNEYKDKKDMENSNSRVSDRATTFSPSHVSEPYLEHQTVGPQGPHYQLNQHELARSQDYNHVAPNQHQNYDTMSWGAHQHQKWDPPRREVHPGQTHNYGYVNYPPPSNYNHQGNQEYYNANSESDIYDAGHYPQNQYGQHMISQPESFHSNPFPPAPFPQYGGNYYYPPQQETWQQEISQQYTQEPNNWTGYPREQNIDALSGSQNMNHASPNLA
jgi:RNA recognition motif-containing protein